MAPGEEDGTRMTLPKEKGDGPLARARTLRYTRELPQLIDCLQRQLMRVEDQLYSLGQAIDGMPKAKGAIRDRQAELVARKLTLEKQLERKRALHQKYRRQAEDIFEGLSPLWEAIARDYWHEGRLLAEIASDYDFSVRQIQRIKRRIELGEY